MKFPLAERPFPRVELNEHQCHEYEQLTSDIVAATLDEYAHFVHVDGRQIKKKLWKVVKTREDVTVYKQVAREPRATTPRVVHPAEQREWPMPKLVAVGTIAGTLDDIMYATVTPDAQSIVAKTSYVNDELLDSAVLYQIRGATHEDPYRFHGLKWIVKGHTATINAVVWPRDVVFVESTSVQVLPSGERIGHHVMHSVEHMLCPELERLSIIRSRISSCYLYRQHRPGTVEIYMMSYVEPGGTAPESIAVMSTANSLIGIWKSMWCAQNKKLSWLLENDQARRRFHAAGSDAGTDSDKLNCRLCSRKFRTFRTVIGCQLCSAWVCSRCCVARKLSSSNETLELLQRVVNVCKNCMVRAINDDAWRIAQEQYAGDVPLEPDVETDLVDAAAPVKAAEAAKLRDNSNATLPGSLTDVGTFDHVQSWRDESELDRSSQLSERDLSQSGSAGPMLETIENWKRDSRTQFTASTVRDASAVDHQQRLLMQMQNLCLAAEETYHTTLNASRICDSSGSR